MDQTPALHLAGPHVDGRRPLAVDGEEPCRRLREHDVEALDHAVGVEHHLAQHHDAVARRLDLRHVVEVALDDDRPGHAARHLDVGAAMAMRMVPVGAPGVVLGQRDLDVVPVAGAHRPKHVVGDAARADVRAVEVEVGRVELVRLVHVGRRGVAVRRQVVDQLHLQRVARPHLHGRPRRVALVRADEQAIAADVPPGILDAERRFEHAVDRLADLGFDERRAGLEGDPLRPGDRAGLGDRVAVPAMGMTARGLGHGADHARRHHRRGDAGHQERAPRQSRQHIVHTNVPGPETGPPPNVHGIPPKGQSPARTLS